MGILHRFVHIITQSARMGTDHGLVIGQKIKRVRELRGLSQSEMARRLHIEQSTYNRIESGETKLDVDRLKQIAGELEMKPEDLLSLDSMVVHVEHISGGTNVNARVEQQFPEEFFQRLTDRYEAHVKELQQMNARLLELLEKKLG